MAQEFQDTQPTGEKDTVDYRDPTDVDEVESAIKKGKIDELSRKFALWIRTKMYRRHVREALARMMEYTSVLFNNIKDIVDNNTKRQDLVEKRQRSLESNFSDVIANATIDSEVIIARQSETYGKFNCLDDRLENIENILANFVPAGFIVKIQHNLSRNPAVIVKRYDWAIGTETNGFDTAPEGLFGGGAIETVPTNLVYQGECVYVHMPAIYKQSGEFTVISDTELRLIDGIHTMKFEIEGGLIDGDIE